MVCVSPEFKCMLNIKKKKSQRNSLGFTQCPDFEKLAQGICRVQVPNGPPPDPPEMSLVGVEAEGIYVAPYQGLDPGWLSTALHTAEA